MKKFLFSFVLMIFIATLILASPLKTEFRGEVSEGKLNGENKTGCIEVIEAKTGAATCKDSNKGASFRFKVNCDKPVDVRLYYKGKHGRLENADFLDKKNGDEITYSDCFAQSPYTILKRDAGSKTPFPNP